MNWTQEEAVKLCTRLESVCPKFFCHVALTGGLLYKVGPRKDCDLLFYRIRQAKDILVDKMLEEFDKLGLKRKSGAGWCYKMTYENKNVDLLFPEEHGGEYTIDDVRP